VRIDWDPPKAKANLRDHGVGFPEAATVLEDELALTGEDPEAIDNASSPSALVASVTSSWSSTIIGMPTRFVSFPPGRLIDVKGYSMKKVAAEPYRDIDFSRQNVVQ
jgi:uncharacterized DUF497 family protein